MVSNARLDLPEPESPVMTIRLSRGISSEMFFRLCTRAPCTAIVVRGAAFTAPLFPFRWTLREEAIEKLEADIAAIAQAMVLNEPLFYYGFHAGNLFQFQRYEPAKVRRKMGVLEVLVRDLPPKLRELGVPQDVIDEKRNVVFVIAQRR